jgi:hypothetical protein
MRISQWLPGVLLSLVFGSSAFAASTDGILRLNAPDHFSYVDGDGVLKELEPRCSGGPKLTPTGIVPSDDQYAIYLREADPRRLLLVLDGGGVCLDPNTCLGSALAGDAVYRQEVRSVEDVAAFGGIADVDNPDNPFRDYTQVLISYCTGDLHWGTKTELYPLPGSGAPWPIHHHGFDNLRWALEMVKSYYADEVGRAPSKVTVAGVSAGGYGVLLALPEVMKRLPRRTQVTAVIDSASGVTEPAYEIALGGTDLTGGVWGVENAVPDFLRDAFQGGARPLQRRVLWALADEYRQVRTGQFLYAFDEVSIFYYVVTNNLDNPAAWTDPDYLLPAAFEWSAQARLDAQLAALKDNYRFYIARGSQHTILPEDRFYTENSAQDVEFRDWVDAMVNERNPNSDWRNVSCAPFCLPEGG